jgi:hypothetical protein
VRAGSGFAWPAARGSRTLRPRRASAGSKGGPSVLRGVGCANQGSSGPARIKERRRNRLRPTRALVWTRRRGSKAVPGDHTASCAAILLSIQHPRKPAFSAGPVPLAFPTAPCHPQIHPIRSLATGSRRRPTAGAGGRRAHGKAGSCSRCIWSYSSLSVCLSPLTAIRTGSGLGWRRSWLA